MKGLTPELPKEKATEQGVEHVSEYKTIRGEKICDLRYTKNSEDEITSCVLIGPRGQRVDVFLYCGVPPKTKVALEDRMSGQSSFAPKRTYEGCTEEHSHIYIHGLESAYQFGVFLHELGHAQQFEVPEKRAFAALHQKKYGQLQYDSPECAGAVLDIQTYFVAEKKEYSEEEFPQEKLSGAELEFIRDFSERYRVVKQRDDELLSALTNKKRRLELVETALRHDATRRSAAVNDLAGALRGEIADLMVRAQESNNGLKPLCREWDAFSAKHINEINRILHMLKVAMERDASAFALKHLRRIREEFGISLLQEVEKTAEDRDINEQQRRRMERYHEEIAKRWEEDCATTQTIQGKFRSSLRTHASDNATVRKAYGAPPKLKKASL